MRELIMIACSLFMIIILNGCAVKPKFLKQQEFKKEAEQNIKERKEEWNWENRHRLRKETRDRLEKEKEQQ